MLSYSKQIETLCSICSSLSLTAFLRCCLTFNCPSCLKHHTCQYEPHQSHPSSSSLSLSLSLFPPPSSSQSLHPPPTTPSFQCDRCSKRKADWRCGNCHGKYFCEPCSKEIHKVKYLMHRVIPAVLPYVDDSREAKKEYQSSSPLKKRVSLLCDDEPYPQKPHLRNSEKENHPSYLPSSYIFETTQLKLETKLTELTHFKKILMQKWENFQVQVRNGFRGLRVELEVKEREMMRVGEEGWRGQMESVQGMIGKVELGKRAFESLRVMGEMAWEEMEEVVKEKRTKVIQELKRIDKKLETLSSTSPGGYSPELLQPLLSLIKSLSLPTPLPTTKPSYLPYNPPSSRLPDSTPATLLDKSQKSLRLSSRSINKHQLTNLLKKPITSIINSRSSIYESPKHSINSSLNSTTKFIKKKREQNMTFEGDVERLLGEGRGKGKIERKREGVGIGGGIGGGVGGTIERQRSPRGSMVVVAPKGRESRSRSKIDGVKGLNGSFVAPSPDKYNSNKIWRR